MSKPVKISQVDVSQIKYEGLKVKKNEKTKTETKQCKMTYANGDFRMITVKSKLPFGVTTPKEDADKAPKDKKYSFEVNIEDSETKKTLENIDERNVQYASDCSKEWFGKQMTCETIRDATYGSLVKKDKKGEYPDRFKFKLPFQNGEPKFTVFDQNRKKVEIYKKNANGEMEMDWSWVQKGMYVEAVVECEGLWIVNKNVYNTWKVIQLKIYPVESNDVNYFDDDEPAAKESELVEKTEKLALDEKVNDDDSVDDETDGEESDTE